MLDHTVSKKIYSRLALGGVILVVLFLAMVIAISRQNPSNEIGRQRAATIDQLSIRYADGRSEVLHLPATIRANQPYTLTFDVSAYEDLARESMTFANAYSSFTVTVDHVEIYRRNIQARKLLPSGGYALHLIDLPRDHQDHRIVIEVRPLLRTINYYKVAPIDIGEPSAIFARKFFSLDLWLFLLAILLLFIFIGALLLRLLDRQRVFHDDSLFYIGLLSFYIALYLSTQLWSFNLAFNKVHLAVYSLEFILLIQIPVPVLLLIRGQLDPRFDRWIHFAFILTQINFIAQLGLSLSGFYEFKEMLPVSQIVMLIITILLLTAFLATNSDQWPRKKPLFRSVMPLLSSVFIGTAGYWLVGRLTTVGLLFLLLGIVTFIAIQLYYAGRNYIAVNNQILRDRIYKDLALHDVMTGLENRMAFTATVDDLRHTPDRRWIISLDMNNLKAVNDTYGHDQGDRMIIALAHILRNLTASVPDARVFRVGGDEFMVFLPDREHLDPQDWVAGVRREAGRFIREHPQLDLAFSAGWSLFDGAADQTLDQAIKESDRLMYINKGRPDCPIPASRPQSG